MKNKKSIRKITKVNTHRRKGRERAKNELLRAIAETNVKTDALRISFSDDKGARGRISSKARKDEYEVEGIFSASKSGFGFLSLDEEFAHLSDRDIFIPEDKTLGALDGDRVEAVFHFYRTAYGEQKSEGRVRKILSYGRKTVIGVLVKIMPERRSGREQKAPARFGVSVDDGRFSLIPEVRDIGEARLGDKVEALLVRDGSRTVKCDIIRKAVSEKTGIS